MLSTTLTGYSQQGSYTKDEMHSNKGERIHAAKVAYITDRLHFTSEQSSQFWPLYNEYEKERTDIKNSFSQKYKSAHPDASDDEIVSLYKDDLDYQQQVVELKIKYKEQYLKIISPEQFAELSPAEREFKEILIRKLNKDHHDNGGRWNNNNHGWNNNHGGNY
jgi:hypothetical protein